MSLALFVSPKWSFQDDNGGNASGWKLYTYEPGTSTPKAAYQDSAGTTPHANPIVLDARGEAEIWLDGAYKFVLKNAAGVTKWTADDVSGYGNFPEAETIAGLRGIFPLNRSRIYLKAHTTEGDGGHGWFRGVTGAAAGTYTDNGGTIIVPTGGDGSSAWVREYGSPVDVRWFGVSADGSDETAKVLSAVAAGDFIYISQGVSYDRSQITDYATKYIIDDSTGIRVTSNDWWWRPQPTEIKVTAHRGFADLAPENTIAAFSNAMIIGAHAIECDVQFTSDGVPVIIHDSTVDRTTDGTGNVADKTLAEIRALDAGSWFNVRFAGCLVPTAEEVFELVKGRITEFRMELKSTITDANIDTLISLIADHGLEDIIYLTTTSLTKLEYARSKNRRIGLMLLSQSDTTNLADFSALGGRLVFSFPSATLLANPSYVEACRSRGVDVSSLPVDKEGDAEALMRIGVTRIPSDIGIFCNNYTGVPLRISDDWSGMDESGTTTVSNSVMNAVGVGSGRVGRAIKIPLYGGDLVEVDFYARAKSGEGYIFMDEDGKGGTSVNNITISNSDWQRYRFRKHVTGAQDGIYGALFFGCGTKQVGDVEYMSPMVRLVSKHSSPEITSARALILVNGGTVSLNGTRHDYGVTGLSIGGASNNEITVTVDANAADQASPFASATGNNPKLCFTRSWTYPTFIVCVYNLDGTACDLTTEVSPIYINITL